MKPTNPDTFQPRPDGWFEHRGTWGEVTVGTVLANPQNQKDRWEIIDVSMTTQVKFGDTLWMRAREQNSGTEFTIRPRSKVRGLTILTQSPLDTQTPAPTPPSDADAIWAIVEGLGATLLARRDEATGEITCPDYASGRNHLEGWPSRLLEGEIEHLRVAHHLLVDADADMIRVGALHESAHDQRVGQGKGGFPHRHVPEDLSIFTGRRA